MKYASLSDKGLHREKNQDSFCSVTNLDGDVLLMICDGIGGGKAGEVASGEVVKYFINIFKNTKAFKSLDEAKQFMNINIIKANEEVFKLSCKYKDFKGMGTTLTGLLYTSVGVITFNVGDSRVYGFADNKMFKLTVDHTLVNEMLQKGEITYEESLVHPKRHYLVKAIGVWDSILADIHQVAKMDQYLVCSDGLSSYVDEEDIKKVMNDKQLDVEQKTSELVRLSLVAGGYDNVSVIVFDING